MLASRLTRSLGQGVKLRQEIIEGCCRQKRPGEGRLLQQKRGIVLKRTYGPPLVKSEVIAGGAMTIPVTQVRSKQSNSDHFSLKKKTHSFPICMSFHLTLSASVIYVRIYHDLFILGKD